MSSLGEMSIQFSADTSGLSGGLGDIAGKLGGLAGMATSALGPVGGALVAAGGAAIGLGVQCAKMAGDFQSSMTSLVTGAGESNSNLKMVSDGVLAMAGATGTSTKDLAAGMYMIESAGYHGAAGLAVLQAAAEGAKVGNASLADVANGVTTAMTDYSASGLTAAGATNFLIAVVANGKTHMADMARSMSTILPTSAALGVSIKDVGGALATMTGEGTGAAQASTYLRQMLMALASPAKAGATALKAIGLTSAEVSTDMKKDLPGTLQMIMTHLAETYKVGSPEYMTALKNIAGGAKQMQGMLELTGSHLATFGSNVKLVSGAMTQGGNSIVGWSQVQGDFNQRMDEARGAIEAVGIKLGTLLLPVLSSVVGFVTPIISAFADWITSSGGLSTAVGGVGAVFQQLSPYLKMAGEDFQTLGSHVLSYFMPVFQQIGSLFTPLIANVGKLGGVFKGFDFGQVGNAFENIDGAVKSLAQGLGQFISSIKGPMTQAFSSISSTVGGVFSAHMKTAGSIVKDLGSWFTSTLMPAVKGAMPGFQSLASVLIGTVVPGLVKLWAIGQQVVDEVMPPLMHVIEAVIPVAVKLAGIISAGLAASLKFLMPYILQAASAIGQFAGEIATRIAPIIINFFKQISQGLDTFMAIWKVVWPLLAPILMGVWNEIVGVIKIAWSIVSGIVKIGLDLLSGNWSQAWTDVKDMLSGIWSGIVQFLQGGIQIVVGLVTGLINGVIQLFTHLWDELVGHSIIPDMVNGILSWFGNLVSGAINWIVSMVYGIKTRIVEFAAAVIMTVSSWISQVVGFFGNLGTQAGQKITDMVSNITGILNTFIGGAASFGQKLIQGIINGITGMFGAVGNTMHNFVGFIGSFLPHSPAEQGELSHLNEYGPSFVKGFAEGIENSIPRLQTALNTLMQPIAMTMTPAAPQAAGAAYGPVIAGAQSGNNNGGQPIIEIHNHNYVDGQELTGHIMTNVVKTVRTTRPVGRVA